MTYAFAAAGTGGHVYPALAVADALVASGVDKDEIVFFGGDRMEATTVPAAGYRFVGVPIRGIQRSLSRSNLQVPGMVLRARTTMADEMRRLGVKVVTVFGGYVSGPAALAGRKLGIPVYLHEQNAVAGLANRIVARFATTSFMAFPPAEGAGALRNGEVVGNPIRRTLVDFDRDALRVPARERYDLPADLVVLGVMGGSLGAKILNDVTLRIADDADPMRIGILHLTGSDHLDSVAAIAGESPVTWRTIPFEPDMHHFYAAVDIVLGRAGALTVSELAATGTPAVVVPYAAGTAGHQAANADHLAASGGVVVVPQTDIDRVPIELEQLLADPERRARMGAANLAQAIPDAADRIATTLRKAADA